MRRRVVVVGAGVAGLRAAQTLASSGQDVVVFEARERIGAHGDVLQPLDAADLGNRLRAAHARGLRSVAIVFMHAYRYPQHEREAARLAREAGFQQVSVSHQISPLMKLVSRGDTTVVDAYLSPILRRYVDRVASQLGDTRLMFMQSNGGLTDAALFRGKDSILSGPAGGVVGAIAGNTGLGLAVGAAAGLAGGYLYDHHKKAQQKAHDQAYKQGYEAGKKSQ